VGGLGYLLAQAIQYAVQDKLYAPGLVFAFTENFHRKAPTPLASIDATLHIAISFIVTPSGSEQTRLHTHAICVFNVILNGIGGVYYVYNHGRSGM
jgi:hypothetical protein